MRKIRKTFTTTTYTATVAGKTYSHTTADAKEAAGWVNAIANVFGIDASELDVIAKDETRTFVMDPDVFMQYADEVVNEGGEEA